MSRFAAVIVNYRSAGLVLDCLRTLANEIQAGSRAIVVDNASGDDSVAILRRAIASEKWEWATVIAADRNGGFAYGNNVAIRELHSKSLCPDYVWLLNPDTYVRPGAAKYLLEFLDANPTIGIAGSGLEFPDERRQVSAFRFPSIPGEFEITIRLGAVSKLLRRWQIPMLLVPLPTQPAPQAVDWVNGASMMIRWEVLQAIGPMDEKYFLYYEEPDFCFRARRAGWATWTVPKSRVVHLEGQTTGVTGAMRVSKPMPMYWFDSRSRYFRKLRGRTIGLLADLAFIAGTVGWRIHSRLRGKPPADPPRLLRDFVRHAIRRWI
jgi:GT2 family glycosyltransferase